MAEAEYGVIDVSICRKRNVGQLMFQWFRNLGTEILDLIYPGDLYCICCGKIIDYSRTYRLCDDCMKGMKWATGRFCDKCGKPLSENNPMRTCYSCREHSHNFDRGYTCAEYGSHEKTIVYALKYDARTDIARTIGEIMWDRMLTEFEAEELAAEYDIICPVPVHRDRKIKRGYNQAALIAEEFAKRSGIKYEGELMNRTHQTSAMKSMTPDERKENIRNAFEVRKSCSDRIRGAKILIIDDIYTTGATVDEVASVLNACGAKEVDFLSFASGADVVKSY